MNLLEFKKVHANVLYPEIGFGYVDMIKKLYERRNELTHEEIEKLVLLQEVDGSFAPCYGVWCHPSDTYCYIIKNTTVLIVNILINASKKGHEDLISPISDALHYLEKRGIHGRGYDAEVIELENINMFLDNDIFNYLKTKKFGDFFRGFLIKSIRYYEKAIVTGRTNFGFSNLEKQIKEMLDKYHECFVDNY